MTDREGVDMDQTKLCPSCGETKARDAFAVDKRSPTGLQSHCRDCQAAKRRAKFEADPEAARLKARRTPEQREQHRQDTARRRAANPELLVKASEQSKRWSAANRDRVQELARARYAANPEKFRAASREWMAAHPGNVLAREARRRGATVVVEFTIDELHDYLRGHGMDPDRCVYCEAPREEWDHATALALGGSHTVDNVVPSCRPCNTQKSHMERAESQRRRTEGLAS